MDKENIEENITKTDEDIETEPTNIEDNKIDTNDVAAEKNETVVADEETNDAATNKINAKQLAAELERVTKEKNEHYDRLMRIQAEYDNYKRRSLKERTDERKYKAQDLALELLPVLDNFERALQIEITESNKQLYEGITMVYNQFKDALAAQGIEEIAAENEPFDPNLHHAVMQAEDESKDSNIIIEELQKGYKLKDRVIRPTMVKVNK